MKKLFTLLLFLIGVQSVFAQMQFLPKFIRKMYFNADTSKRPSFVLLPVLSSAPETGIEAGGAALLSFYTDTIARHNTRVSQVFGYATLTTKGQDRLALATSYWTPGNTFHYFANISFINFPFDFYGIGNNTKLADVDHVGEHRYRLRFDGEKLWGKYIYVGYVFGAYDYIFNDANHDGIFYDSGLQSKNGGAGIYAGPSFTFDSRNNNTYTTRGLIVNAYLNIMHGAINDNNYKGAFFNIEYSEFFLLDKKLVLGLDVQEQSLLGGLSPFYLLPQMGSDEMMRGYYGGRYRDRNFIAGQTELRYRINKSFGIVGFVGTGEVFHSAFSLAELKPNYGGGVRYFFDIQKGLSIRADYGFGQKPAGEPRETGFYIGLGQSF